MYWDDTVLKGPMWDFITERKEDRKQASWLSVLFTVESDIKHGGCPIDLPYGLRVSTCL